MQKSSATRDEDEVNAEDRSSVNEFSFPQSSRRENNANPSLMSALEKLREERAAIGLPLLPKNLNARKYTLSPASSTILLLRTFPKLIHRLIVDQ